MATKIIPNKRIIVQNRKVKYDYHLEEFFDAGIVLFGSEIKSLRAGKASVLDAYAEVKNGEVHLVNSYIAEYNNANKFNHDPYRIRKLLLHKKEIKRLDGKLRNKGLTLAVLSIYFNHRNLAKIEIALARGKKAYDKREVEKKQDWEREKSRVMRDKHKNL
ncbi:SsrA-binding protein [Rickettsiales bacterium Ac37b]|nr:SsrA-binding protein [Rickettsiales bacterium Ac37b]